jgi:hypothetical protein
MNWVRSEFEQHRKERDLVSVIYSLLILLDGPNNCSQSLTFSLSILFEYLVYQAKIKALLSNGKRQLKQLSSHGMLVGLDGDKFRGRRAIK